MRVEVIQRTRDLIEIVAIVLAGIWAIYIFVYENRIKPAAAPPEITVSGWLNAGQAHNGLVPVRIQTNVKNVGTVTAHFLGFSIAVVGTRVNPKQAMQKTVVQAKGLETLTAYYTLSHPVVLYRFAFLTHATDSTISTDMVVHPGEEQRTEYLTYVPSRRFDRLALRLVAVFTKSTKFPIRGTLSYDPIGVPRFRFDSTEEKDQYNTTLTSIDMAGR